MKILLCSHAFYPSVGGTETVAWILAHEFTKAGHEVKVVTAIDEEGSAQTPFAIYRNPGKKDLLDLTKWCEVMLHNNISLQTAWPLIWIRRPWVIAHHTRIPPNGVRARWQDHLKLWCTRWAKCIAVSQDLANDFPTPSTIIGNPYDHEVFRRMPDMDRNKDLVYVGRFVSEKAPDLLLDMMLNMKKSHFSCKLTMIGDGPERQTLENKAQEYGIEQQIHFTGSVHGHDLARILNQHKILLLPSRCRETFGLSLLEGLACGCAVIGSNMGGIPATIDSFGLTFPSEDAQALADAAKELLQDDEKRESFTSRSETYLTQFHPDKIAQKYLDTLEEHRSSKV